MSDPAAMPLRCVIVSHTHWDREWYRPFEAFRARLVDTVDRVLDLLAEDPDYRFQLDGQTIVIEDYLAIRPEREAELGKACREGRLAIGPWYVQPDSLIPSGETHIRNLLEGRRVASRYGGSSRVAYTPDSFGHPAQLPQILRGCGLSPFIYWRGNGNEIDELPAEYRWRAPDGTEILACHLGRGYFNAWGLQEDPEALVARLEPLARELAERSSFGVALLLNGIDHSPPDDNTREAAEALACATGVRVERGLLDDFVEALGAQPGADTPPPESLPVYEGELLGARSAHLLPGVWSTHSELKIANRRAESLLFGWTEPFSEIGRRLGAPDERPALRRAWRALLANQAHDSICGCSHDRVHERMHTRYHEIEALADETLSRTLERIAGLPTTRVLRGAVDDEGIEIAVFNPSPRTRSDVVRLALDGFPAFSKYGLTPLLAANFACHDFEVDGHPARVLPCDTRERPELAPGVRPHELEFVARDVPAFGWRRLRLARRAPSHPEQVDEGREIAADGIVLRAAEDGTLELEIEGRHYRGLAAVEDIGDRGDSYDFDPVEGGVLAARKVSITRRRHASGIQSLELRRVFSLPACLGDERRERSDACVDLPLMIEARVAPGVARVDLDVRLENRVHDHRLRLLFPTGVPCEHFEAASTFAIASRSTAAIDDSKWVQRAPRTFPSQGWIRAGGLLVAAPGLVEAEVTPQGVIALTLLRAVGWLSRADLETRPGHAGPALQTPGAQCLGGFEAKLSLLPAKDRVGAHEAELGLRACAVGPRPLLGPDTPLLEIEPAPVELSAFKPAEDGDGSVLRLSNPSARPLLAVVRMGEPLAARLREARPMSLGERPLGDAFPIENNTIEVPLPPYAIRSFRLR